MDTAMMRKRGNKGTTYRQVCVTNTRILRSGVPGNGHAPFWNSGRRGDPSTDCIGIWKNLLEQFRIALGQIDGNIRTILERIASILIALTVFALFVWHLVKLIISLF
jgi:hypothetical protein